jgi:hypothetical protein
VILNNDTQLMMLLQVVALLRVVSSVVTQRFQLVILLQSAGSDFNNSPSHHNLYFSRFFVKSFIFIILCSVMLSLLFQVGPADTRAAICLSRPPHLKFVTSSAIVSDDVVGGNRHVLSSCGSASCRTLNAGKHPRSRLVPI